MKNDHNKRNFRKTFLSTAVAAVITTSPLVDVQADIYEFTFSNGGIPGACAVGFPTTCPVGEAWFTILDPSGIQLQNTSYPYYGDDTWGYGLRTQIDGSLIMDSTTGVGNASIAPFEFFTKGPAVTSGITMKDVPEGDDPGGNLWLTNMTFAWNSNTILTQVTLDFSGIIAELPTIAVSDVIDATDCGVSGACATPASNLIRKGRYPIGPVPVATSSFNIVGATGVATVLDDLSLGADDAIGGTPNDNGPFSGFNANFDFGTLTLAAYNDTTAPVLTLGSATLNLTQGDAFDENNPGVSVTCADAADGADDLTDSVGTNANISFTVDNGNGGAAVDISTVGSYEVLYTCTDNASARAAITDDPNTPAVGDATVPTDNTSPATTVLTVNVSAAGVPSITITNGTPTAHQACTTYTDAGATYTDPEDGGPFAVTDITDATPIIGGGNEPNEGSYSIVYNAVDTDTNAPAPQTRTVNVTDTTGPVIAITGGAAVTLESTDSAGYVVPAATATDANGDCNAVMGGVATTADTVDFTVPAGLDSLDTTLRYFASDTAGTPNQSQSNQVVTVERSEPVITLIGGRVVLNVGDIYVEQGMDVHDVQDGDLTAVTTSGSTVGTGAGASNLTHNIVIRDASNTVVGSIDSSVDGGRYTISYDVTDSDANTATSVSRNVSIGVFAEGSNFTMLNPEGMSFGGTNDVVFDWDETFNTDETDTDFTKMLISSALPQPFFSFLWTAHHIRVYGPGTYSFDTTCTTTQLEAGTVLCNNPLGVGQVQRDITMTVGAGQVGVHILFDWGKPDGGSPCGVANCDMDIVNVWEQNAIWNDPDGQASPVNNLFQGEAGTPHDVTQPWKLVSTDLNADGINGSPMVDGPFIGFYANFNAGGSPADSDGDEIFDGVDNCPLDYNPGQGDFDDDGVGDVCDMYPFDPTEAIDSDGDGVGNNADAFPFDPTETQDTDGDGVGDNADAFPLDPTEILDTDGDGVGDNADAFPFDPTKTLDTDRDGIDDDSDNCPVTFNSSQLDSDNDGTGNSCDAFPFDSTESLDTDGDGVGDNADEYPLDSNESSDTDGDGVGDNADNCPAISNSSQLDTDNDGTGNSCDVFPFDPTETLDTDGDGVGDNADAFPFDPAEIQDADLDNIGDNTDNCPAVFNPDQIDTDSDSAGDSCDAFMFDPTETLDTDLDNIGDNADNCPAVFNSSQLDFDNDSVGNSCDAFPFDSAETLDSDVDGVGDNADNCPVTSNANQNDSGGVDTNSPDGIGDACQCGDLNGDGKITNTDSRLIRLNSFGWILPAFNPDFCDVNGDAQCTNTDAVLIHRTILGLPPGLRQTCAAAGN